MKTLQVSGDPPDDDRRLLCQDVELDQVRRALSGIRYGEIRVIVQDGVVVQIERTEKHRIR